ncbi:6-phospho 3-hexuloisomerase [candidate division MSBL1 archaeon SCGC-AAA259A05]|uniref:6-phospho 3-hexuloisomerase n=1 Tax=candidate division MSBL1 archaeon SCGC-AAA259A05 TaxID=1698259 RepID=A0A133UBQ2_9EURY|nr:6-phospho 3-hexuloisomerase [candidate division MSBL1 archaeon SCGC-AAA259A05]
MEEVSKAMKIITGHIQNVSEKMGEEQVDEFVKTLLNSERVFVAGAGRSGLIARAFAMRLMHLNAQVHVIGETITPRLKEDDLFLGVSGSGETARVVSAAKSAKEIGAKIGVITSYPDSSLGKLADLLVKVPGRVETAEKKSYTGRQIAGEYESLTPLGTLFEATTLTFLDGVIASLMRELGKKEEDLSKQHASVE